MLRIRSELIARIRDVKRVEDLYEYLQNAIELEHATIPLYLTPAFSIKPGYNSEARTIILSVANQEMLHMTIAANILNAIGGAPTMDRPGFIPLYPGPLPMNVHEGLTARLAKLTRGLVSDLLMVIEEPERPIKLRVNQISMLAEPQFAAAPPAFATIGEFYKAIKDKLRALGDGIFKHPSNPQVVDNTWFPNDQMFPVTDFPSACKAINVIVEQGEGTRTSPLDSPGGEPAHYYRLAQIVYGRLLVKDASTKEGYSYSGAPVPLNPAGIWNLYPDAKVVDYEPGRARNLVERFNYSYTALLRSLHTTFNGNPQNLKTAIGMMYELKLLADDVVSTPVMGTDYVAAPTFEYSAVPR